MTYIGDFKADTDTVYFQFNTRKSTGEPVALLNGLCDVFRDGETAPITMHAIPMHTEISPGQYAVEVYFSPVDPAAMPAGADYSVVLTRGTVDGIDVSGTVLAQFSIENRYTGSSASGAGAVTWEYSLTEEGSGDPITDCRVWVTSDKEGRVVIGGPLYTDAAGSCTFYLDEGTVYVWCMKAGYLFANPDEETVAAA